MTKGNFLQSINTVEDDDLSRIMLNVYYFLENHRQHPHKQLNYLNRKILEGILGDVAVSYLFALIDEYEKRYGV